MSVRKNTIFNLIGALVPMVIGLISIPNLIGNIGVELFGILSIIWMLIGYFGLFDLGIGRSITQQIAKNYEDGNSSRIKQIVFSGIFLSVLFGILGALILALFSYNLAYHLLGISESIKNSVYYSILVTSIAIPLTTVTSCLRGILEGEMNFRVSNLLKIILGTSNFVVPVLITEFIDVKLESIVWGLVFVRVVILVLHLFFVRKLISINKIDFKTISNFGLLKNGSWMTVSTIIGPIMVVGDRFLISNILGASVVAYYTIPFDAIVRILIIPTALSSALLPKLSSVSEKHLQLELYRKGTRSITYVMLPLCLFTFVFSKQILNIWLGGMIAENAWVIMSILSIGVFFNSLAQIPFTGLHANENPKSTAIIHLVEFIFYMPLLVIGLNFLGVKGAAVAYSLRCAIDYFVLRRKFINK